MRITLIPIKIKNNSLLEYIKKQLELIFNSEILIDNIEYDIQKNFNKSRNQYYSTEIISNVIPLTEKLEGKVVLLVNVDLFVPVFTYLFGEAQFKGKLSIVSTFRLYEEFYTGRTDDKLFYKRVFKEVLHELGHNFGLRHCEDWNCVMHASAGIEEVDVKGAYYCRKCEEVAKKNLIE
ncbi:MAG: archaemetzincin family Zn-dependent metalloprotease [Melioribacteraceae bacterium]|nr:MAG: archaemetzincin family Zn-dependent metalloprotease [Melioribacteraceae bacterium]